MTAETDLAKAKAEAAIAKARLMADAHTLQARLNPANVAEKALAGARARGAKLTEDATRFARTRPAATAAAAIGVVALLARRPLGRLLRIITRRKPADAGPRRRRARRNGEDI